MDSTIAVSRQRQLRRNWSDGKFAPPYAHTGVQECNSVQVWTYRHC